MNKWEDITEKGVSENNKSKNKASDAKRKTPQNVINSRKNSIKLKKYELFN